LTDFDLLRALEGTLPRMTFWRSRRLRAISHPLLVGPSISAKR
jgi:hypothetical protein